MRAPITAPRVILEVFSLFLLLFLTVKQKLAQFRCGFQLGSTFKKMDEYFRDLRNTARKIDGDIKELEKTWESPEFIISGFGQNVDEANHYVENLLDTVKDLKEQVGADLVTQAEYIKSTSEYVASVQNFYQDLKQHYQEVDTLLSECGHQPLLDAPECISLIESETESSILTPEQMENSISSACSFSTGDHEILNAFVTHRTRPESIATPVIKSLASARSEIGRSKPIH